MPWQKKHREWRAQTENQKRIMPLHQQRKDQHRDQHAHESDGLVVQRIRQHIADKDGHRHADRINDQRPKQRRRIDVIHCSRTGTIRRQRLVRLNLHNLREPAELRQQEFQTFRTIYRERNAANHPRIFERSNAQQRRQSSPDRQLSHSFGLPNAVPKPRQPETSLRRPSLQQRRVRSRCGIRLWR